MAGVALIILFNLKICILYGKYYLITRQSFVNRLVFTMSTKESVLARAATSQNHLRMLAEILKCCLILAQQNINFSFGHNSRFLYQYLNAKQINCVVGNLKTP